MTLGQWFLLGVGAYFAIAPFASAFYWWTRGGLPTADKGPSSAEELIVVSMLFWPPSLAVAAVFILVPNMDKLEKRGEKMKGWKE